MHVAPRMHHSRNYFMCLTITTVEGHDSSALPACSCDQATIKF